MQRTVLALLLLVALPMSRALPQSDSSSPHSPAPWALWLTLPVAPGISTEGDQAVAAAVSFQRRQLVLSVRLALGGDRSCTDCEWPPERAELAMLAGYGSPVARRVHWVAGAGLATVGERDQASIALAGEFQLGWQATRIVGVGLYVWANSAAPTGGLGVVIRVGRLR